MDVAFFVVGTIDVFCGLKILVSRTMNFAIITFRLRT